MVNLDNIVYYNIHVILKHRIKIQYGAHWSINSIKEASVQSNSFCSILQQKTPARVSGITIFSHKNNTYTRWFGSHRDLISTSWTQSEIT